jgi:Mg-chelatase subunit ChlI
MFQDFSNLTSITGLQNLDISSVKNTSNMFNGCKSLSSADFLTDWNVLSADKMSSMFATCSSLTLDCKNWQVKTECDHTDFNTGADNVQLPQAWRTTQTESGSLASSQANESNSSNSDAINNQEATKDKDNTDALTPDSQQDKSSSTEADTKDKATGKTADKIDTQQADTKAEEAESVSTVLLNFTSSITSFFNNLKLTFV